MSYGGKITTSTIVDEVYMFHSFFDVSDKGRDNCSVLHVPTYDGLDLSTSLPSTFFAPLSQAVSYLWRLDFCLYINRYAGQWALIHTVWLQHLALSVQMEK